MDNNSFSFMKEGFDWEQEQAKDMQEIRCDAVYEEERERRAGVTAWTEDRHDSDAEQFRQESLRMQADDLWDAYRDTGMRPSDFISEVD